MTHLMKYWAYLQGGDSRLMYTGDMLEYLEQQMDQEQYRWQANIIGHTHAGHTQADTAFFDTLREAVQYALPECEDWMTFLGLGWRELAFIAMVGGLILSGDAEVHPEEEAEDD